MEISKIEGRAVTLLVPCHNAVAFLGGLHAQVEAQRVPFAGVIVYDDASTDGSAGEAARLGWRVLAGTRARGPGFVRNRLLEAATTPFVHYHDADDDLDPGFVETLSGLLQSENDVALCALRIHHVDGSVADEILRPGGIVDAPDRLAFALDSLIHLNTAVFPTRWLRSIGGFSDYLRFGEDRDLVVRLAGAPVRFRYADVPLATWNRHGTSLTNRHSYAQMARFNRWYLHRCYRKLPARYRPKIGQHALYLAWNCYRQRAWPEARAYIRLAKLCGVTSPERTRPGERWLIATLGVESLYWLRSRWAALRERLP